MRVLMIENEQFFAGAVRDTIHDVAKDIGIPPPIVDVALTFDQGLALACTPDTSPDLVLLDLNLDSNYRGISTVAQFREHASELRVAVFTGMALFDEKNVNTLRECVKAHQVKSFLLKDGDVETIHTGLKRLLAGEDYMPHDLVMAFTEPTTPSGSSAGSALNLTPAQLKIARGIADGLSNKEIARTLGITEGTVRTSVSEIYSKISLLDADTQGGWFKGVVTRGKAMLFFRSVLGLDAGR